MANQWGGVREGSGRRSKWKSGETVAVRIPKNLRETVEDPQEQTFYGLLESIEREHRLSLQDTYEYFKDPEGWFERMEKPHLDGA